MGLLSSIADDAAAGETPTSQLLRRLKVVAARSKLPSLAEWVDHELSGYPPSSQLPAFRGPLDVQVRGRFLGPFGSSHEAGVIPSMAIQARYREDLFRVSFREPLAELETLIASKTSVVVYWSANLAACFDQLLEPGTSVFPGYECHGAWRVIGPGMLVGIIDNVRTRLMNLALELEPLEIDGSVPPERRKSAEVVVMQINGGTNNVAIASQDFEQGIDLPKPGDVDGLLAALREADISADLVDDLTTALSEDDATGSASMGPRVTAWLGRWTLHAATTAESVAVGASGGVVARLLANHFNIGG
jgi:hypothetical protein